MTQFLSGLIINGLSSDTQVFSVKSGATDLFAINQNGTIGVGTASTNSKFYIYQDTIGTGAKSISINNTGALGEMFYIDNNGVIQFESSMGVNVKGSNGLITLISNGGVNPSIGFKYNNGSNTSGTLAGDGTNMLLYNMNNFGVSTSYLNASAKLHVVGSDSTSSNYGLKVDNSTGGTLFNVRNDGNVGIGISSPSEKLHISGGTIRINTINGTEGAGKIAVSDSNGSISFSSTTALGIPSGYATTLTTPGANVTNTITHNLGTTDISVSLWLVTTGDLTSARVTNRTTNTVDVIFSSAPGEDVRVVVK